MFLIVGLGNPGEKYKKTRHNAGFRVVDEFEKKFDFPAFVPKKKFDAEISEGVLGVEKVLLSKPQSFMNNSGVVIKKLFRNYKLKTEDLVVIHDDIDLPLGKIRISLNGGSAGHKGVQSVIQALGSENFIRLRVGILPEKGKPEKVEAFVLKNFTKIEAKFLKDIFEKSVLSLETIVSKGSERAMQEFN